MLRCRKCRKVVVDCLQEVTDESSEAACNIWHMDVDTLPEWILTSVHMALWTVGRLNCPNCRSRLGGFNFIHRSKCPCGRDATVHFSKCRVDHDHKQNHLKVQDSWSWPLLTDKSDNLQLNTLFHMPLPDTGEASQVMSQDRSTLSAVLYPMNREDEASSSAVSGCSSVSAARKMVQTEEDEGSSAESTQEQISLSLSGTPIIYSPAQQEEEIVPGSLLASATLHRQQKKEKNRLKSQRRKQRRREKWLQKQTSILSDLMLNGEEENVGDTQGLTCAVCLDVYFHPHSCQPCSHVFCEPCLRMLAKNREENTPCPLCRTLILHTKFHAGYWRYAVRASRRWCAALQTFNLSVCSWLFDIGLAVAYTFSSKCLLAVLFLVIHMYYLCI
ncbi:E3 ubiquitin-protein ligase RNF180-like isoform X2 [Vanacampus margaritifer]